MVNESELTDLLRLYSIQGIGSARFRNLISMFGTARNVLKAPVQRLINVQGIEKSTALKIKNGVDELYVQRQLNYIHKNKIQVINVWDKSYPTALKKIYDPPSVLFMVGQIIENDSQAIAVVGTREPSGYGRVVTENLTRELVGSGFTIISGMARGVDTISHHMALKCNGRTIAVLGSGLDIIYPPENTSLFRQISENGAVITEFPFGAIPDPGNFPRRNRIVSGLSLGVLVIEAGVKSGAIITAFEALEQNREVFAVPGPINSRKSIGTNRLIKEGAKLVQNTDDILQELESKINIEKKERKILPKLAQDEKQIYELVSENPTHIDHLTARAKRSTPEVLSVLLTLELMGIIKQLSGKMFIRM